ncbi:MAG: UbiA family prenyltransferase [Candidatus Thermoplasmatota archaeon]|nr:UbiA family prenyltransferase [Candidatus Thermoplasmatota archaeon]
MKKIHGIISVIRPEDGLFGAVGVYVGWAVASERILPHNFLPVLFSSLSTFLLIGVLNIFNDLGDIDIDRLIHTKRALASGSISEGFSKFYLAGLLLSSAALAILAAFFAHSILLSIIFFSGLVLGLLYEIRFKKQGMPGNITIAILLFLPFLLGASISGITHTVVILCMMAFVTGMAKEIINDVKDVEGDRGHRKTLPNTLGVKPSLLLAIVFLILTILISAIPVLLEGVIVPYMVFIGTADLILVSVMIISFYRPVIAHRLHSLGMVLSIPAFLSLSF